MLNHKFVQKCKPLAILKDLVRQAQDAKAGQEGGDDDAAQNSGDEDYDYAEISEDALERMDADVVSKVPQEDSNEDTDEGATVSVPK